MLQIPQQLRRQRKLLITAGSYARHFWGGFAKFLPIICLLICWQNNVKAEGLEEYAIKSAITYNLAVFTEWPEKTFKNAEADMHICVVGDSIVQEAFLQIAAKKVSQHSIKIVDITRSKNINGCHIVYIGNQDRMLLSQIQNEANGKNILTIDDTDGFSTYKSIVNLQEIEGRIRLNINVNLAQQSNLKISARVLKLANIVVSNH